MRLRQDVELSQNIFVELKLELEYFCPKREEKIGLRIFLSKKAKRRKGVGLRIICPKKGRRRVK